MTYFAIAANGTLASLVNVTTLTEFDPSIEEEFLTPLTGKVRRKLYSGVMRHDGYIDSVLVFNVMRVSYYRTFMNSIFGGFTTASKAVALTLLTPERGVVRAALRGGRPAAQIRLRGREVGDPAAE